MLSDFAQWKTNPKSEMTRCLWILGVVQFAAECTKELKNGQVLVRFDLRFLTGQIAKKLDCPVKSLKLSIHRPQVTARSCFRSVRNFELHYYSAVVYKMTVWVWLADSAVYHLTGWDGRLCDVSEWYDPAADGLHVEPAVVIVIFPIRQLSYAHFLRPSCVTIR